MHTTKIHDDKQYLQATRQLRAMPGADICWLCEEKIDMTLIYHDKMAWTADHVQSLHMDGDPYSLANLKPAHRSCNSKRGNQIRGQKSSRVW